MGFQCVIYQPAIHCLPLSVCPLWFTWREWKKKKKKLLHFLDPSFVAFICHCVYVWRVYMMSKCFYEIYLALNCLQFLSVVQEEMVNKRAVWIILHGTVCVLIGSYSQYKMLSSCFIMPYVYVHSDDLYFNKWDLIIFFCFFSVCLYILTGTKCPYDKNDLKVFDFLGHLAFH